MDVISENITLIYGMVFFVIFLLLSLYYFSKKSNYDAIALFLFGVVFLITVVMNLLSFILPIFFFLFFISILNQYLRKKQSYQLLWSISMFMFFLTTLFQAIGQFNGNWDPTMLKVYYIFAAFQVMLLGLGELYLLCKRNILTKNSIIWVIFVSGFFWMLFGFIYYSKNNNQDLPILLIAIIGIVIMLYGILDVIFAFLKKTDYQVSAYQYTNFTAIFSLVMLAASVYYTFTIKFLSTNLNVANSESAISLAWTEYSPVRAFSPIFAGVGGMLIFIGCIFSYILWQYSIRKNTGKVSLGTGLFNIYFALGVLIFVIGGTLSHYGIISILYTTELLGGIIMYFGFLESDKISLEMFIDIITLRFLHKEYQISENPV